MPYSDPDAIALSLLSLLRDQPAGLALLHLQTKLAQPVSKRTLQRHLTALVRAGQVVTLGTGRATAYALAQPSAKKRPSTQPEPPTAP